MALGATPGRTIVLVVRQSLGWPAIGVVLGLLAAGAVGQFVEPLLFQTSARDRLVYAFAGVALLEMAAAASALPAFRVGRVDPAVALQTE